MDNRTLKHQQNYDKFRRAARTFERAREQFQLDSTKMYMLRANLTPNRQGEFQFMLPTSRADWYHNINSKVVVAHINPDHDIVLTYTKSDMDAYLKTTTQHIPIITSRDGVQLMVLTPDRVAGFSNVYHVEPPNSIAQQ